MSISVIHRTHLGNAHIDLTARQLKSFGPSKNQMVKIILTRRFFLDFQILKTRVSPNISPQIQQLNAYFSTDFHKNLGFFWKA